MSYSLHYVTFFTEELKSVITNNPPLVHSLKEKVFSPAGVSERLSDQSGAQC